MIRLFCGNIVQHFTNSSKKYNYNILIINSQYSFYFSIIFTKIHTKKQELFKAMNPKVIIHNAEKKQWLSFENPLSVLQTCKIDDVIEKLKEIQTWIEQENLYAAGFLSYETSPAFDSALKTYPPDDFPLLWFGLYHEPTVINIPRIKQPVPDNNWQPAVNRSEYHSNIEKIKSHLRDGNTYQVNYTFPLKRQFNDDPWALFSNLIHNQQSDYGAYLEFDQYVIASISPEQFFLLNGNQISSLPMKGTAPRGRYYAEDMFYKNYLFHSSKDRAENSMIVDIIRNDIGRIAEYGSVKVSDMYHIEQYPTVWQMVSKVTAKTDASISEIFQALFPCASITGAPKVNTMKIINNLEITSRRIYTGSIGFIVPGRKAQFNVAIRTLLIDKEKKQAEYGVGGGIVWDSINEKEYDECFIKARALTTYRPEFQLLESILWTQEDGYFILDHHLIRMKGSAEYFNYKFEQDKIIEALDDLAKYLQKGSYKVRLLLSKKGEVELQSVLLEMENYSKPQKAKLAKKPVDSNDTFLFHKTTHRNVYDQARVECPECEEVLLFNEKGEITEFTNANVLVKINGQLFTPPVECGLLSGTYRQYLLDQKMIQEKVITLDMLKQSEEIILINSVRKSQKIQLINNI